LAGLVERVLRFSQGDAQLELTGVDAERTLQAALERCQPWRDRKRFEVTLDVAADARRVRADEAALTSLLHNLIENAIKYGGAEPAIHVAVTRSADDVVLRVSDDGPGIAAADRARVFEAFQRGSQASNDVPGNGLGLAVARDIAEAHGGRLELVASATGATFELTLPANGSES